MWRLRSRLGLSVSTVLAIALLAGASAWLVQCTPRQARQADWPAAGTVTTSEREILRYSRAIERGRIRAVWEVDAEGRDTGYELEAEPAVGGVYYFPFENRLEEPVELGLLNSTCDCTSAEVCVLDRDSWQAIDHRLAQTPWAEPEFGTAPDWHPLVRVNPTAATLPAHAHGLLRVRWENRKKPGGHLRIRLSFWCRPVAAPSAYQVDTVDVPGVVTQPIRVANHEVTVGTLSGDEPQRVEFLCWSPTRPDPDVVFAAVDGSPLFTLEVQPLSPADCSALQTKLRARGVMTRVQAAHRLTATLRVHAGSAWMDQGPFERLVSIKLDGLALDLDKEALMIHGIVKGDVEIGGVEDQNQLRLGTFPASQGKVFSLPLRTAKEVLLEPSAVYPDFLRVHLRSNPRESTALRTQWDLRVTVPPDAWSGTLPDNSHVTLRIAGKTPRLVRIPVVGTATR